MLDENVRVELARFLRSKKFDVKQLPKTTGDALIAKTSREEERIVVTNDEDFAEYTRDEVFSVIWLRVPQNDPLSLVSSFNKLLNGCDNFKNRLILLKHDDWDDFPLSKKFPFKFPNK